MDSPRPGSQDAPLTVSRLVRGTSRVLERNIGTIYVSGEVTSLSRAASGHLYFALADERAQLRCVMWRSDASRLKFRIEDGAQLVCRGRLGIYERDGKFQLYVQGAQPEGLGADALALAQRRQRLAAEGLFDPDRKRPLPLLPRRIGVVTSKSGAAVRDIVRAVERRFPVPILVADARVQGDEAPSSIALAIRTLCATDVDVVIVGRGGGSSSDLGAFNEEEVVRAVAACTVPVISAVGHEVDVSLTDLAADRRAATPTMAGEMAVPVRSELLASLEKDERRLTREIGHVVRSARQELDAALGVAERAFERQHRAGQRRLTDLESRLAAQHPRTRLVADRARLGQLAASVEVLGQRRLDGARRAYADLVARLDALSPLSVLERGYAIATAGDRVLRGADEVEVGDAVELRLSRGSLGCRVETRRDDPES